jgi:hypothetical protein
MQMRYQLRHSPNIVLPWSRKDNAENISRHPTAGEIGVRDQVSQRQRSQIPSTVAASPASTGTTISATAPTT